jgi:hypothetical protein
MFVRSLKTGGEVYIVARVTSVSESHQSKMAASLHGEYNGLTAAGSFKAAFTTAMEETSNRSEVTVFMSQAGGSGGQTSFTGPDAAKILERLSAFPQSVLEHPVGYEAELASYDTIPIAVLTPEESDDRNIVLADCLAQKMGFLKALSDLQFLLGPNGSVFFEDLPPASELEKMTAQYRGALNALMSHAIKVSKGLMNPPQTFQANPVPPQLNFKKRPVSLDDKVSSAEKGAAIAKGDPIVAAFRELQRGRSSIGIRYGNRRDRYPDLWGGGKQRLSTRSGSTNRSASR